MLPVNLSGQGEKTFVLDTNVLLNDPYCIDKFGDNNIIIPMVVLEEIDSFKKGQSTLASSARIVTRFLDELRERGRFFEGIEMDNGGTVVVPEWHPEVSFTNSTTKEHNDNVILQCCIDWKPQCDNLVLITEDINMRIRGDALGIDTEGHDSTRVEDVSFYDEVKTLYAETALVDKLYSSYSVLRDDPLMGCLYKEVGSEYGYSYEESNHRIGTNEYCVLVSTENDSRSVLVRGRPDDLVSVRPEGCYGIEPRNKEQTFALDSLMDPDVKLVVLAGQAGCGKAQPLDSKVMTPDGPVEMGDIELSDNVLTPDGSLAKVVGVFPQGEKEVYRVNFTDGTSAECCEEHLWETKTCLDRDAGRDGTVKSLEEISETLRYGASNKRNHSIPITNPVEFNPRELPLDPYLMGVILGDGCISSGHPAISNSESEIIDRCNILLEKVGLTMSHRSGCDYYIVKKDQEAAPIKSILKDMGLYGCHSYSKFVPEDYKFNSIKNRTLLLQGLMDTDGTCSKNGHVSFTSTSKNLANDLKFIVQSLGGTVKINQRVTSYTYDGEKREGRPSYRCNLTLPNNISPFLLDRKGNRVPVRTKYFPRRYIDSVEPLGKKECQCILVDSEDHLYMTNDFIVTHNTLLALAAGLEQTVEQRHFEKMTITRPIVPLGNDIGYLPGDLKEKLDPWMAPIYDNLAYLHRGGRSTSRNGQPMDRGKEAVEQLIDFGWVSLDALTYIRGRSISNQFVLVDEAQNLSAHEIKTIVTRIGQGSKLVVTGDPFQIDNPYLDTHNNGLSYLIDRLGGEEIFGSVVLLEGERSELAEIASNKL